MIRINLLPYTEKKKKETKVNELIILVGSFVIFLTIIIIVQVVISSMISSLETNIKEKEDRLVTLNKIVGTVEDLKRQKSELERKLSVIGLPEKNRLYPVHLLDELATIVPAKDMWLEKVTESGKQLQIDGIARDPITVARFMKSLETASFIQSVDLVSSKQKEINTVKLQEFSLTCVTKKGM